ncbi:hypothetical protein [uncultured Roseibium sp.]|uniref:hypothetical protein n=1 Tax=uncultured Roseibium sp. TaxID=1936171 RepID=UPI00321690C7
MTRKSYFAAPALAFAIACGPAAADDFLSKAEGTWRGKGWAKQSLDAPKEAVLCRITNTVDAGSNRLKTSGRCAVASQTFTVEGQITLAPGSGRITGTWHIPQGSGNAAISGQRQGNRIVFTFQAPEKSTKQDLLHKSLWTLGASALTITASVRRPNDGKYISLSSLNFSK